MWSDTHLPQKQPCHTRLELHRKLGDAVHLHSAFDLGSVLCLSWVFVSSLSNTARHICNKHLLMLAASTISDCLIQLSASLCLASEASHKSLRMYKQQHMCTCRELGAAISTIAADKIRPIQLKDFRLALKQSKPSVNRSQIAGFERWTQEFGTNG